MPEFLTGIYRAAELMRRAKQPPGAAATTDEGCGRPSRTEASPNASTDALLLILRDDLHVSRLSPDSCANCP